jgi:integrase
MRIERPSDITEGDIEKYLRYLKTLQISRSTAESRLGAIRMLWTLRTYLPDGLKFDPFANPGSLRMASKRAGKPNKHTSTLPPPVLLEILNDALRWVDYAEPIQAARDAFIDAKRSNSALAVRTAHRRAVATLQVEGGFSYLPPGINLPRRANTPVEGLEWAVACLYGAAITLILAFTAMRKHELALLETDALFDRGAIEFIKGLVRKPAETEAGTATERAIHPIGASAIRVLERLGGHARVESVRELLVTDRLLSRTTAGKPMQTGHVYTMLDRFTEAVGYERFNQDRALRPHMLRRAHILLWAWRYEIGDLEVLRRHLYHGNIQSTLAYTNEGDISAFLPPAQQKLAYAVLEEALTGSRPFVGGFGKLLTRFRTKYRVLSLERLQTFVKTFVDKHQLRLIAHPQGYCVVSAARGKFAACRTNNPGPDYANRTDEHCAICPNFLAHCEFSEHWENQLKLHTAVAECPQSSPALIAAARDGVRACTSISAQFAKVMSDAR